MLACAQLAVSQPHTEVIAQVSHSNRARARVRKRVCP